MDIEIINDLISYPEFRPNNLIQKLYLPKHHAYIREFACGKAVLSPNSSPKLVVFPSLKYGLEFLESNEIPIINEYDYNFPDRKIYADLENSKHILFQRLSEIIDFEIVPSVDYDYLDELSNQIRKKTNRIKKEERLKLLTSPLGIFVGESRVSTGLYKWEYIEMININPYLLPTVSRIIDNDSWFFWGDVNMYLKRRAPNLLWVIPPFYHTNK